MTEEEMKIAISAGGKMVLDDAARLGIAGQFIELPIGNTRYQLSGEGETIVLVHGYATPYFIYDKLFSEFVAHGYKVLRYDLLGRGYSERVFDDYTPELFAQQLHELVNAVLDGEQFTLVGTSMGGTITTTYYRLHPERVSRLVLLAPAGMDNFRPPFYMKLCKPKGLGEYIFNSVAGKMLLKKCASEMTHATAAERDYYERSFADAFRYDGFLRCTLSSLRHTILNTAEAMQGYYAVARDRLDTLCIWGTADATMPYYQLARFAEVCPHAKTITYEGSGHIFVFDEGQRTAADVLAFLAEK